MQGENVCNFTLLCISVNKLFERNERFSFVVYCNCMVEKNFHFTEALCLWDYVVLLRNSIISVSAISAGN